MAKEKFERTKPHVNVGTIGHVDAVAELAFRDDQGNLDRQTLEDGPDADSFIGANIESNHVALCLTGPQGSQMCFDTSQQSAWPDVSYNLPLLAIPGGDPLLVEVKIEQLLATQSSDFPDGQTFDVIDGQINDWVWLGVHGAGDIATIANEPLRLTSQYSGQAEVVGFVELNIPEPTSLLVMAGVGFAVLARRMSR